jgi:hypothetical protein
VAAETVFTVEYQPPPPPVAGQFWIKTSNGPDLHLSSDEMLDLYTAIGNAMEAALSGVHPTALK